ncbi:initiator tRNA phosphoribosyl transferase [Mucor lusitanicus]|uniref:Initiator tRNA phosphoribosyl transferase n=1 Tax=Mucor circinelloides f. lusitanicus TaxID=29924 RepID=A0A8H4BQL5_MUCCL|nr:initiator tRNA phosphoribosyl transferase [Mucor lusitanicus]
MDFEEEDLFAERNEFNFESKLIRNDNKNIYNRLCSIVDDATFVMKVADLMPSLALIANERCGSWYIDRTKRKAYSAYFKSTDGHMHIWDFNIRRNNLHLIPILMRHNGCLIVDSTRKGKRIPDALSKTIPIWCCTVNRAVATYAGYTADDGWDLDLHTLPSAVSRSEHAQIEARIDGFVDKLLTSGVDMKQLVSQLKKPLRPIWFTPQSYDALMESPPDFQDASFCPVVCLSASEAVKSGYQLRPGYLYVQGSADDEEAWALGLTHSAFWKHRHDILTSSSECERNVKSLVARLKDSSVQNDDDDDDGTRHYAFIKSTPLAIGDDRSGKPPHCWDTFDYVINCSQDEYELNRGHKHYLHLPIPDGKKGQIIFGACIQKAIDFVRDPIIENKKILVYCATGKDHSVGILLSILIHYYTLEFELNTAERPRVDKKMIQHQLVQIISNWEKAAPSRVTLKRINTHFMSHSSHDNAK